jgi:hypothetical protein
MEPARCVHCHRFRSRNAGRELCPECHAKPGVRAQYPLVGKKKGKPQENGHGMHSPSGQPEKTLALPGTEEKIAALEERARSGLELWHKQDRQYDDPSPWQAGQREEDAEDFFDD